MQRRLPKYPNIIIIIYNILIILYTYIVFCLGKVTQKLPKSTQNLGKFPLPNVANLIMQWQGNEQGPYINFESLLSGQRN